MFQKFNKKIVMKSMLAVAMFVVALAMNHTDVLAASSQLKTLSIQPGQLTPAFSPEVTDYSVTVDGDVASLSIKCSKMDADAQIVEATGFKNLSDGLNNAVIKVQASDGTTTTYTLAITKGTATGETGEGAEATASAVDPNMGPMLVGGDDIYSTFLVCPTFDPSLLPQGFEMQDYNFRGTTIQSAYFAAGNLRLLFLTAGDGTDGDFRIYLEDEDEFYDFIQLKGVDGQFIVPTKFQAQCKIPDNYSDCFLPWGTKVIYAFCYTELTGRPIHFDNEQQNADSLEYYGFTAGEAAALQGQVVDTTELDADVEFYLLYAINQEGKGQFYLYDSVEKTFQRYVERDTSYDLDQSYFKYKDVAHQRFTVMCALFVLLLIAVFAIVHLSLKVRTLGKKGRYADEDYEEYDDDVMEGEEEEAFDDADSEINPEEEEEEAPVTHKKIALMGEDDWEEEAEDAYEDGTYEDEDEYYEDDERYEDDDEYYEDDQQYEDDDEYYEDDEQYEDDEYYEDDNDQYESDEDGQYEDDECYEDDEEYYEDDEEYEDAEDYENSTAYADYEDKPAKSRARGSFDVDSEKDFRMVNLSRSQVGDGIDDDFEFEFINLEDN